MKNWIFNFWGEYNALFTLMYKTKNLKINQREKNKLK